MNVNYHIMLQDAEKELGDYFQCPANTKSHLMLIVFPWVQQRLRNQLCEKIKELSTYEMNLSWDWIDRNVWSLSNNVINLLFKK